MARLVIVILEVSNLGTSQPDVHRGKISKLASLITHLRPIGNCIKTLSLSLHTN